MPKTLPPIPLKKDLDDYIEYKKLKTGTSFSQFMRDLLRASMEKDKRKNK